MSSARRLRRGASSVVLAFALAAGVIVLTPVSASAATITVTDPGDAGPGTLRAAVAASSPGDIIEFDPSVTTVTLDSYITIPHSLRIGGPLTIQGGFSIEPVMPDVDVRFGSFILDGTGFAGVGFQTPLGAHPVRDMTIGAVTVENFSFGGATLAVTGHLDVHASVFRSNTASAGAGLSIQDASTVAIRDTTFESNAASDVGGGLLLDDIVGPVSMTRTTFNANSAVSGGGAIAMVGSMLFSITDSVFTGNTVSDGTGGAIHAGPNAGILVTERSTFRGNASITEDHDEAVGGAISMASTSGAVAILQSTFRENSATTADGWGTAGAVAIGELTGAGQLFVDASTFADNPAIDSSESFAGSASVGVGGFVAGTRIDVINSTFRESTDLDEDLMGIGLFLADTGGALTVQHSTFEATAAAVIFPWGDAGTAVFENSILSGGVAAVGGSNPNLLPFNGADLRHNVLTGPTWSDYNDLGGNQFNTDPMLGALQDNGGPTHTMLLGASSPAINAGTPGVISFATDQRGDGFARVLDGTVDVGAVEVAAADVPPLLAATGADDSTWLLIGGGGILTLGLALVLMRRFFGGSRA